MQWWKLKELNFSDRCLEQVHKIICVRKLCFAPFFQSLSFWHSCDYCTQNLHGWTVSFFDWVGGSIHYILKHVSLTNMNRSLCVLSLSFSLCLLPPSFLAVVAEYATSVRKICLGELRRHYCEWGYALCSKTIVLGHTNKWSSPVMSHEPVWFW
jgi:hypothetical protein